MKILIIGGGASGMAAALSAAEHGENEILLLERQARLGRKLLATGNGRCNLSNLALTPENYHGEMPSFCRFALETFSVENTLDWFRSMGLLTVHEPSQRVYPLTDSANSVVDVLRLRLEQKENVTLLTGREVTGLRQKNGVFHATTVDGECFEADRAIVCAGGLAGGKLGGTDLGYRLLASFGHTRTKLFPALVQVKTETTLVRALKGVRCQARVRCGDRLACGEVQFTDYGISGPLIFGLARQAATGAAKEFEFDFLQDLSEAELEEELGRRCAQMPRLAAEHLLTGLLHNRLGRTLLRGAGVAFETPLADVDQDQLCRVVAMVKHFSLGIQGVMGMDEAQVTAGGIRTTEFDETTMESRLCRGLYAAGEVLDIDGDCGGYNLQWAWSSGRLAGEVRGRA